MGRIFQARDVRLTLVAVVGWLVASGSLLAQTHSTGPFKGVKVNSGTAIHSKQGNQNILTLSDDFQVPDTPDPHWQVVDSKGTVYLLERLDIKDDIGMKSMGRQTSNGSKGDKRVLVNRSIVLPGYIKDLAKVQIYCAWAETLLGEASFSSPVK